MKNIIIKVFLLLSALLLAVGAVLYYLKSRVEPPRQLRETNQAATVVQSALDQADWQSTDMGVLWTQYQRLADLMMRLRSDSLRPDYEADLEQLQSLNARYATRLLSIHDSIVGGSYTTATIRQIYPYVKAIEEARGPLDEKLLDKPEELRAGLNRMWAFSKSLDNAWRLVQGTRFESMGQAKSAIGKARALRQDDKLKGCVDLMKAVDQLPRRLGRAHYASLQVAVNSLAINSNSAYDCMHRGASINYSKHLDKVNALLNEYAEGAQGVYGEQYALDALVAARDRYVQSAMEYYNYCNANHYH